MATEPVVMQCGHCGNTTGFEILTTIQYPQTVQFNQAGAKATEWRILRCPVCGKVSLDESIAVADAPGHVKQQPVHVLFPQQTILPNLPERVDKAYRAALRVRHEPIAFAVTVGRTLETICNHENAVGNSLMNKLNNLASSGRMPQTLAEMGHQLRIIRNIGAHDTGEEITPDDIPVLREFLEAILEYLYIAPARIDAVRERLAHTRRAP